jgi:hypothetical protein
MGVARSAADTAHVYASPTFREQLTTFSGPRQAGFCIAVQLTNDG